jgi:predicted phosphodiesterase
VSTGRSIVIGDVHGCADELDALLKECGAESGDDVLLVGDLIAKGPASRDVLARVRDEGFRSVRGNHDAHVLRWKEAKDAGVEPLRLSPTHAELAESFADEDWAVLKALPMYLRVPEHEVIVVHAGLVPAVPLEQQEPALLMNLRSIRPDGTGSKKPNDGVLWASLWLGPELVLFGHHASAGLQVHPHAIGLDTGCVYGGKLSACILPERKLVSVPAKRQYSPITRESAT